ncbi:ABC transporter permease subunit [Streptomyces rimosus]|uniref:ABC transporter permease subunit n=1 Tax=Streptomyces rimosus TaxID=1927 RepID=UPI0037D941FD
MTSPQQPQPQPQPEPHDTAAPGAAAPMPPAGAPEPPAQPPAEQPEPRPLAAHPQPEQPPAQAPVPPQAGPAPQEGGPAREAGTMTLQAQQPPAAAPGKEAGTMMLQAQAAPQGAPLPPQGAPKDAGTMTLQAQQPPTAPPQQQPYQPQQAPQPPQQQIPAAWQAAGPGGAAPAYVSPIPVRRTNLGHALASEWTKIRSVRSTMWTLGVMIVLNVGIGLMAAVAIAGLGHPTTVVFGSAWFGLLLGTLCVIPLGVLVISSEYGTGMIRTTFTACPSRGRVLTAKAIVLFGLTFVITTVSTVLVAVLHAGMIDGPAPTADQWLRATLGSGLYVAVLSLLALGAGTLLRHSAGAISAMMGLVLLPMLLAVFMLSSESLRPVAKAMIEYSVPNSLGALYDTAFMPGGPSGWQPLLILVGVTAVVLGGAYAALEKRDV